MLTIGTYSPTVGAIVADTATRFRTWAPAQKSIRVVLDDGTKVPMTRDAEGYFSAVVAGVGAGRRYWYELQQGLRPDPASRFQPDGPLGASQVIDPRTFNWTDSGFPGAPPVPRNVVYEMHIGTFTPEGTWRAAAAHLESLARLGITTLEVMPIAEFAGDFGWGYDGVDFFAPAHLYGTPDAVRHFVNEAHRHGLAVILDVVYNHFGPVGNFLRDFAPAFFGKPGEWGDSINYDGAEAGPVRAFMIENAAYWISEYHLDGLRFDATHGIWDSSPSHIIGEMCAAARAAAGDKRLFLVGESEPQDVGLLRVSGKHVDGLDAIWNEDWHHAAFVALTGRREAYFTDYRGTANEFASMARHGLLYQGQWYTWQKQPRGGFSIGLPPAHFVSFLENHDQVANTGYGWRLYQHVDGGRWRALTALLLAGPQIPMLFQGQEFASAQPFTYFAHHEGELAEAVRQGRLQFLQQFPALATPEMQARLTRPDDRSAFERAKLVRGPSQKSEWALRLHRDLLALRQRDTVLSRVGSPEVSVETSAPTPAIVLIRYISELGHRLVVANLQDDYTCPMNDPLLAPPPETKWTLLWSSDSPEYGGGGVIPIGELGAWLIRSASAMVLAAEPTP